MSGHSKWATIKHKKGALDAKRGKIFSKISKELMVAAKQGGSDPGKNPTLRNVIEKARSVNMPGDNVDRAIKKGAGELQGQSFEEIVYEGFASGGVAMIIQVLTDNKNRAASEIRHIFTRHGSSFATHGSVSRGFVRKGQIFVEASAVEEDKLLSVALDAGAEDVKQDGDQFEILTDPATFADVVQALEKAGIPRVGAEVSLVPLSYVSVTDKAVAASVMKFVSDLEEHDDVQNVYTNMDVAEAILKDLDQEKAG
jgi:YebC/PmpR family DNA-binding regulatory protein